LLGLALARPAAVLDGVLGIVVITWRRSDGVKRKKKKKNKEIKDDIDTACGPVAEEKRGIVWVIKFDTHAWALGRAARAGGRQLKSLLG
jgi:hypothetical protein